MKLDNPQKPLVTLSKKLTLGHPLIFNVKFPLGNCSLALAKFSKLPQRALMKKLKLHIGLEKTGTTYIQGMLARNYELLKLHGILYPKAGREGNHHYWIAKALGFKIENEYLDKKKVELEFRALQAELKNTACETILLSSEHFDFQPTDANCKRITHVFSDYEIEIILSLRNQIEYAQSLYSEYLKWGGIQTFLEFLETPDKFNFYKKYCIWKKNFEVLNLIDYDHSKHDLLNVFLKAAGTTLSGSAFDEANIFKNTSPPIDFMECVRQTNLLLAHNRRRDNFLNLWDKLVSTPNYEELFQSRDWGYPLEAKDHVINWENENKKLSKILASPKPKFLDESLVTKFNNKINLPPPNTANLINFIANQHSSQNSASTQDRYKHPI